MKALFLLMMVILAVNVSYASDHGMEGDSALMAIYNEGKTGEHTTEDCLKNQGIAELPADEVQVAKTSEGTVNVQ